MKAILSVVVALGLGACAGAGARGGAPAPAPDPVSAEAVAWTCGDGVVFFTQATRGGNIEVAAGGQTAWLPKVKAASGTRYKSKTAEFWEKGGEASLSGVGGGPYSGCRSKPAPQPAPQPAAPQPAVKAAPQPAPKAKTTPPKAKP